MLRFEHPLSLALRFSDLRFYAFPGGCATYRFAFAAGASPALAGAATSALSFQPRSALVDFVRRTEGLAARPGVTIRIYPADNHFFISGSEPSTPAEYELVQHMDATVISDIANWITGKAA